jgi:hypothetical protein
LITLGAPTRGEALEEVQKLGITPRAGRTGAGGKAASIFNGAPLNALKRRAATARARTRGRNVGAITPGDLGDAKLQSALLETNIISIGTISAMIRKT